MAIIGLSPEHTISFEQREQQRIAHFEETLARVVGCVAIEGNVDLTRPRPAEDAGWNFVAKYKPETDQPRMYFLPELSTRIGDGKIEFEPLVTAQKAQDGSALSSDSIKNSGHGVFFGILHLPDGDELPVAVKPHRIDTDNPWKDSEAMRRSCLKDFYANIAAHAAGFDGLQPVGVIMDNEGVTPYSLTVLDDSLKSLDDAEWRRFYEPNYVTIGMRDSLDKLAMRHADIHCTGNTYHGDLAPRNAASNLEGQMVVYDWELGNITFFSDPNPDQHVKNSKRDIRRFMHSLAQPPNKGIGMFQEHSGEWWDGFKDVYLDRYVEWRTELAHDGSHCVKKVRAVETEMQELQDGLRMDMLMLQDSLTSN